MMFERRRPVASANITTGLMLSGMHSINRSTASLVPLLIDLRILIKNTDGYMQDGSAVVDLLLSDIDRGGPVSSQLQQAFGFSRKVMRSY